MKKVLFITNYFYPEYASLGQLMTDLCQGLQKKIQISVIAMIPGYTEDVKEKYKAQFPNRVNQDSFENIDVYRVYASSVDKSSKFSRIKHIVSYFAYSILAIIKSGPQDVIFCVSQPPILGGLLGVVAKVLKGAKLIYNIQDFNPEQIEAVGYSKKPFLIELLRKLDNITLRLAGKVVLVGRDQKNTLEKRISQFDSSKVCIINNWIDQNQIYPLKTPDKDILELKDKFKLENKKIFMYSGNLGLFYDLEGLVKIMAKFKDKEDLAFVLAGDGAVKPKLIKYCEDNKLRNIVFVPYQEKEKLLFSLNMADVHIVANLKGIKGVSVPSKLYGVMAVAKPILGILENGTEARLIIDESGCGLCCEPGNYVDIENKIQELILKSPNELSEMGKKGRDFLEEKLSMEKSLEKYLEMFENI